MALGGARQRAGESRTGGSTERRPRPALWAVIPGAGLASGAPAVGLAALHLPPMICLAVVLAGPPLVILASALAYAIMGVADRKAQQGYLRGLELVATVSGVTFHLGPDGVEFESALPAAEPGGQQLRGVS